MLALKRYIDSLVFTQVGEQIVDFWEAFQNATVDHDVVFASIISHEV